jgi:hypothetical protein
LRLRPNLPTRPVNTACRDALPTLAKSENTGGLGEG